ncbi:hypothetical protein VTO42DRAFT_4873 [Malbranchea cinnamomea]
MPVNRFINRHSRYSRSYDYQRVLCEDPKVIRGWFERTKRHSEVCTLYTPLTGFQMGVIGTAKVVTGSESLRPKLVHSGNTEWVTIVEGINATGWSLPPMIILKGEWHQASWYENGLPETWRIETSESGWTNEKLDDLAQRDIQQSHSSSYNDS